jgi:hypothetical protein
MAAMAASFTPAEPGAVLGVPLEKLAAWEAHTKPVPYMAGVLTENKQSTDIESLSRVRASV